MSENTENTLKVSSFIDHQKSIEYKYFKKMYGKTTMFDILGVERSELQHSNFIAWLLKPKENHKLDDFALKRLLETALFAYTKYGKDYLNVNNSSYTACDDEIKNVVKEKFLFFDSNNDDYLLEKIRTENYKLSDISIKREKHLKTLKSYGRADLFIEFKLDENRFLILIENKVTSSENDEQTEHYFKYLTNKKIRTEYDYILPIYLCPIDNATLYDVVKNDESSLPKNRLFLLFNYQYLLDGVLSKCLYELEDESSASRYINEYITCLCRSSRLTENGSNLDISIVMASKSEESENANKLWQKYHQDLLEKAYAINNNEISDVTEISIYQTIFSHIAANNKDDMSNDMAVIKSVNYKPAFYMKKSGGELVMFKSKGEYNRTIGAAVYYLIKEYCENNPNVSYNDLLTKFQAAGIKPNTWLLNIFMTQDDVKKLRADWEDKEKKCSDKPLCTLYNNEKFDEQSPLKTCPLLIGRKYFSSEKKTEKYYNEHSCPVKTELKNSELSTAYFENKNKLLCEQFKPICLYFFLHNFYCDGIDENYGIKRGVNKTFGPIVMNGETVYVARFWSLDYVTKVADTLGMADYISSSPDKVTNKLNYLD